MSTINHTNIDEWLFNYFEGHLTSDETTQLRDVLHKNPAFKADYEAWKSSYITEPEIIYPNTNTLLKPASGYGNKWRKWSIVMGFCLSLLTLLYMMLYHRTNVSPTTSGHFNAQPTKLHHPATLNSASTTLAKKPPTPARHTTSRNEATYTIKTKKETRPAALPKSKTIARFKNITLSIARHNNGEPDSTIIQPLILSNRVMYTITEEAPVQAPDVSTMIIQQYQTIHQPRRSSKRKKELEIIRLNSIGF